MASPTRNGTTHLDVLIVGAGLSGIGAGHYLQTQCPWATYAIFEARDTIGGTWDLFRYPGIRSDSDMHTLGYSFRPWDGEKSIADGDSILQYIKDTAAESGIDTHIRFNHRIIAADWSSGDSLWHVTAERTDSRETVHLTACFLFSCSGYYRYDHGYRPDFAGMADFAGTLVHPQAWPEDLDVAGKRIVVIGSGATAVTLVPALARSAAHVTMLQRSPTYIASLPEKSPVRGAAAQGPPGRAGRCRPPSGSTPSRPRPSTMSRRLPEAGPAHAAEGSGAPAARRLRHRHPLHARATTPGTSASAPCPTATSSSRIRDGTRIRRHGPHRALHREGPAADVGRGARGRHHRDRHRARTAVPGRHRHRRRRRGRRPGGAA